VERLEGERAVDLEGRREVDAQGPRHITDVVAGDVDAEHAVGDGALGLDYALDRLDRQAAVLALVVGARERSARQEQAAGGAPAERERPTPRDPRSVVRVGH
jgi:hypothetical protein